MRFRNKIDFQAHYLPRAYYDFLEEEGLYCPDGFPTPEWDEAWQQQAMEELGISYALLSISSPGVYTGSKLRSQELDGRGALAVMHPTQPAVMVPDVNEEIPVPAFEYFVETTRTFLNMVQNDTFTRYPNIRWVIPHAGAFLSILADRFESFALMLRFADPDRRADIMEDMAHVYYDMAGFSEQKQLEMLLRNVDESHLLYGSDTPYTDITACVGQAEALENTEKLTQRQKQLLFTDNALTLLPELHEKILKRGQK